MTIVGQKWARLLEAGDPAAEELRSDVMTFEELVNRALGDTGEATTKMEAFLVRVAEKWREATGESLL